MIPTHSSFSHPIACRNSPTMVHLTSSVMLGLAGLASIASTHPGHDHKAEAAERAAFLRSVPLHGRSLDHCAPKLKARGVTASNVFRRESTIQNLRRKKRSSLGMYLVLIPRKQIMY